MTVPALKGREKLQDVMNAVAKTYGDGVLKIASDVNFAHKRRISTGIVVVDAATGGGIPRGRVTLLVGEPAVGKSTLCLKVAGEAQKTCRDCHQSFAETGACGCGALNACTVAYLDAEGTFDPEWARALGCDPETLLLLQPEYAQQGADIVNKMIRTGELDLLVIDSVAMMTPSREIEESAEAGQRPDLALIINRFMRTLQAGFNSLGLDNERKPAVLLVNQFRDKVGVMYGDPTTWPGGKGQNFAASIRISMRAGKAIDAKGAIGGKDPKKIGVELFFRVEKNKTYTPNKAGSFKLYNDDAPHLGVKKGDINNFEQLVETAIQTGLVERGGSWLDCRPTFGAAFENTASKNGKFQGAEALMAFLAADMNLTAEFRAKVLEALRSEPAAQNDSAEEEDSADE